MTTGQRIAILVSAVVILAGAFVLAQGSDDDSGEEQTLTPTEQQAATDPTGGAEAPTAAETAPATTETAPEPRVEAIRIRGGEPVGDARTLAFESGETVRLRFSSDTAQEIHIHGYDRYVDVPAGGSKTDTFKANAEGIFEVELHSTGALLAKLEIQP
jgi:FtsP/CotA-like multicopper oxidase with cupredoxin domain